MKLGSSYRIYSANSVFPEPLAPAVNIAYLVSNGSQLPK
jgi:hypothetical protein